jgi:hypothetical protein
MANKVLLKKSSVGARVPTTSDLDYGELALNYADGKLYYKTSSNTIKSFTEDTSVVTLTGTQTLTNKTLTSPTINSGALSGTFSGAHTYSGAITLSDTTASTSTTTGSLKVGGGLGVAGSIYADKIYAVNNGAGTNFYVGDDVVLGDVNQANTLGLRGLQDSTQAYIVFGSSNNTAYIGRSGTNPITVTGQFKVDSGVVTGTDAIALQIAGYANKGGTGYHDFLKVTNSYGSATNPNKFFRLNSTGSLEIINSAYTANLFTIADSGAVTFGGTTFPTSTGTNGYVLTTNGSGTATWSSISGASGGTVTSITAGTGLTGGTITTSGTIAIDSTVVTLTGTQTLTNKTLTSPSVSNPTVTGTITAGGSAGTSGQVLTSTGTGVQWSAAGFQEYVSISSTGISSSTTVYSASATTYRGAKYTIQITNSTAYAMYEFLVMHDGTSIYFPYNSTAYSGDSNGNYQNFFSGDYLDSVATTKIQVGNTYHALNWTVTGGNLVFSASCSSGTIDIKGAALLIKA